MWPQLRNLVDKKRYIVTRSVVCAVRASGDLRDDLLSTLTTSQIAVRLGT